MRATQPNFTVCRNFSQEEAEEQIGGMVEILLHLLATEGQASSAYFTLMLTTCCENLLQLVSTLSALQMHGLHATVTEVGYGRDGVTMHKALELARTKLANSMKPELKTLFYAVL